MRRARNTQQRSRRRQPELDMDGQDLEGLALGPGVDVKSAMAERRAATMRKEVEKGIRVVRISKKEISLLDVIDTERCVRIKLHLQMCWYDPLYAQRGPDLSNPTESSNARDENGNFKQPCQVGEQRRVRQVDPCEKAVV